MAYIKQNGLSLIELEQPFLGGVVDARANVLCTLFDLANGVAFVLVEHEAGRADHAS